MSRMGIIIKHTRLCIVNVFPKNQSAVLITIYLNIPRMYKELSAINFRKKKLYKDATKSGREIARLRNCSKIGFHNKIIRKKDSN